VAFHDVAKRKKAERALAEESAKNAMLLRTASDGIHVLDMEGKVVMANDAFCRMLGYTQETIHGMNVAQWEAQWSDAELKEKFRHAQDQDTLFETRHRRCDGTVFDVEIHAALVDIGGQQLLYASARDITERKKAAALVNHLAHFDILTDLPNRALLNDRLQQALAKARRDQSRMALMFLDLDRFKPVNDRLGHNIGDLLLKEVAVRMQCCVRESDTVARVGGDEFVVLLPCIGNEAEARLVAQKILAALEQPFLLAGHPLQISASIGIAVYPEHGIDEYLLIKRADQAMYLAKHAGGAALVSYEDLARREPSPA
jgi:diguanylate cyclase (GGDEF)-like protein/PAS domain S-box-containing protein